MNTPICDFINEYRSSCLARFHMPGHKGKDFLGFEENDITEIPGADVLYSSTGIIRESEENAAKLFGTKRTVYSAEGSSLSIRAMLYLLKLYAEEKGENPFILAGRNAHKVFVTSAALLGIETSWIFPENGSYISCDITAERLEKIIFSLPKKPTAVYLTSPDYLGNISDIKALSKVCHKNDILLFVDNAHGAYLNFLPENLHPIYLGADLCCDSAHKSLPCLTGSGYLHISDCAPDMFSETAERAMALFASTSPSYLILQSLDKANIYLEKKFRADLSVFSKEIEKLKNELVNHGFELVGDEKLKITLKPKAFGYTGDELAKILEKGKIYVEFSDSDFLVMMFTPQNNISELEKLKALLLSLQRKEEIKTLPPKQIIPKQKISAHNAIFCSCREEKIENCLGKILALATVSCPPAIPIVSLGEEIDETAIELFKYYGIEKVVVVKM